MTTVIKVIILVLIILGIAWMFVYIGSPENSINIDTKYDWGIVNDNPMRLR